MEWEAIRQTALIEANIARESEQKTHATNWRNCVVSLTEQIEQVAGMDYAPIRIAMTAGLQRTAKKLLNVRNPEIALNEVLLARENFKSLSAIEAKCLAELQQTDTAEEYLNRRLMETLPRIREYAEGITLYSATMAEIHAKLHQPITVDELQALASDEATAANEVNAAILRWRHWKDKQPEDLEALAHWQEVLNSANTGSVSNISNLLASITEFASNDGPSSQLDHEVTGIIKRFQLLIQERADLAEHYVRALTAADSNVIQKIRAQIGQLKLFAGIEGINALELYYKKIEAARAARSAAETALQAFLRVAKGALTTQSDDQPKWSSSTRSEIARLVGEAHQRVTELRDRVQMLQPSDAMQELRESSELWSAALSAVQDAWRGIVSAAKPSLAATLIVVSASCFSLSCIGWVLVYVFYEEALNEPLHASGLVALLTLSVFLSILVTFLTPIGWIPMWRFYVRRKRLLLPAHKSFKQAIDRLAKQMDRESPPLLV